MRETNEYFKGILNKILDSYAIIENLTDNHLEPREGIRFEILHNATDYGIVELSDYNVNSINLTTYIPFLGSDTLLINAFQSR